MSDYTYSAVSAYIKPENILALRVINTLIPALCLDRLFTDELSDTNETVQKMQAFMDGYTIADITSEDRKWVDIFSSENAHTIYEISEALFAIDDFRAPDNTPESNLHPHAEIRDNRVYIFIPVCFKDIDRLRHAIISTILLVSYNKDPKENTLAQLAVINGLKEFEDFNEKGEFELIVRNGQINNVTI